MVIISLSAAAQDSLHQPQKPSQTQEQKQRAGDDLQKRIEWLIRNINLKPSMVTVNQNNQVVKEPDHKPYNPDGTRNQDFVVRPDYSHPDISNAVNVDANREKWMLELIQIGKPAVPALVKAVTYEGHEYREYYAQALGKIGDMRAVPALLKFYQDGVMQLSMAKMIRSSGNETVAKECEAEGNKMINAAVQALEDISGEKYGKDFNKWQLWWRGKKENVDALPVPTHYKVDSTSPAP